MREAWRASVHDDLVLGVAMAVWFGEQLGRPVEIITGPPRPVINIRQ